jgi:mannose-6-phosphate isomerase-like protein (cupin superfamily)
MNAVHHPPGDGERHRMGPASETVIKAGADETAGSFFLSESVIEPGFPGPPPHRHERLHDMFFVLEGTLTMRLGEDTLALPPRSFVCVPPGVVHTFSNPSEEPVRFLNFNTPSGWENYMRDLAQAATSAPLTPQVIGRIASRYDFHVVAD